MFVDFFNDEGPIGFTQTVESSSLQQSSSISNQSEYIEQFFEDGVLSSQNLTHKVPHEALDNLDKIDDQTIGLSPKAPLRIKSKFHNYQKHLIITLRKTIKIQRYLRDKSITSVKDLWDLFCSSRIYNKSLLRILFGQHMMEQELNLNLFKKEGFKPIIQRYSQDEVIQAQHSLRKIVLTHFEENSLDNLLNSRKLPKETKETFKKYIEQFIAELRQGNVMKRLPKSRKKFILTQE